MATRGRKKKLTEAQKDAVCRDYQKGEKIIVMELEHGIYASAIYRILRERQIPLRRE